MKFLVALDRSPEATDVLAFALTFARGMDADVTVVHAIDPDVAELTEREPITTLSDASQRLVIERLGEYEDRATELLERAETIAADHEQQIHTEVVYGDPVVEVTTFAEELGVDVIFAGHRSRSERMDRIVGSTARGLVERATLPVMIVR